MKALVGVGIIGSGLQAETYATCLAKHVGDGRFVVIWGGSRAPELAERFGSAGSSAPTSRGSTLAS